MGEKVTLARQWSTNSQEGKGEDSVEAEPLEGRRLLERVVVKCRAGVNLKDGCVARSQLLRLCVGVWDWGITE